MTVSEVHWLKLSLRLKLRQSNGNQFQDFFSLFMEKIYGSDYLRVRPYGATGDKGCDGYLQSSGAVFQCYGAINGSSTRAAYLVDKMESDFYKARSKLSSIMKEWRMAHNLVDGLPIVAVETLRKIEIENPEIACGFIGLEWFEDFLNRMSVDKKTDLLGPVATNRDAQNLQPEELRALVSNLAMSTEHSPTLETEIKPVPKDKLEANQLPGYWNSLISVGWQNAHLVSAYFNSHHDPLLGERIASMFRDRYEYLTSQALNPASIMDGLYEYITGIGSVHPARQVAAQALLAHLFESCDIFERPPDTRIS